MGGTESAGGRESGSEMETDDGSHRTVGDILGEDRAKHYIKYNVGVFIAIGLGFALAFILLDAFGSGGGSGQNTASDFESGSLVVVGALFVFFFAPIVSAITGTVTALNLDDTEKAIGTVASAGAFVGFLVFLLLLIMIASMVGPRGSSDIFTEDLLAMIGWGVGVAAAGGGTAYVTERFT